MKGLDAARMLYVEKGAAIIHEHFPEYEERIACLLYTSDAADE